MLDRDNFRWLRTFEYKKPIDHWSHTVHFDIQVHFDRVHQILNSPALLDQVNIIQSLLDSFVLVGIANLEDNYWLNIVEYKMDLGHRQHRQSH